MRTNNPTGIRKPFRLIVLFIMAATYLNCPAQNTILPGGCLLALPTIEGYWQGKLKTGGTELRVVFVIGRQNDSLTAVIDSPDQYTKDIPTDKIWFQNDSLYIRSKTINASYRGRYLRDKNIIRGHFSQNGMRFNMNLKKTESRASWNRPQTPQPPFPYQTEEVSFASLDTSVILHGTLCIPEGKGPFPIIVMVSGSGWQDRDESLFGHQPFWVLADYLARNGIASLRYDDRPGQATTYDLSLDAEGAFRLLQSDSRFIPVQTGIFGHSEGGTIAWMIAARNRSVGFIISMGGVVEPMETMEYQLEKLGFEQEKIPEQIQSFRQNAWFDYFFNIKGKKLVRRTRCPVLAINGSHDVQVPVKNVELMQKWSRPNPLSQFVIFPECNHLMQKCAEPTNEYGKIEQTIDPAVLEEIAKFIQKLSH